MLKTLATFLLLLSIANLGYAQEEPRQHMKIHGEKITVNDSLCYQVKKGYSRHDTTPWEPFCGVLDNFYFMDGYGATVIVKEYNPQADTMFVIKCIRRGGINQYTLKKS